MTKASVFALKATREILKWGPDVTLITYLAENKKDLIYVFYRASDSKTVSDRLNDEALKSMRLSKELLEYVKSLPQDEINRLQIISKINAKKRELQVLEDELNDLQ